MKRKSSKSYVSVLPPTNSILNFITSFFILPSRESDGGAVHRTHPDWLRSCPCFRVFQLSFVSNFFNLLLARFHQAEIIVLKHLIQGRQGKDMGQWVQALIV